MLKRLKIFLKRLKMKNKITAKQREILRLLIEERQTPKQIASRRKTSLQAVYKTIHLLRRKEIITLKKGIYLFKKITKGLKFTPPLKRIRLHNQQFYIKFKESDKFYKEFLRKNPKFFYQNDTFLLYKKVILCYSNQVFWGNSPLAVEEISINYYKEVMKYIENKLHIKIRSIKEVRSHYSETDNEMAKDCLKRKEKVSIKADEDSKEWAKIDNSFNLKEFEAVHPKTAKADIEKVTHFLNDLRNNEKITITDIKGVMKDIVLNMKDHVDQTSVILQFLEVHFREHYPTPQKMPKQNTTLAEYIG